MVGRRAQTFIRKKMPIFHTKFNILSLNLFYDTYHTWIKSVDDTQRVKIKFCSCVYEIIMTILPYCVLCVDHYNLQVLRDNGNRLGPWLFPL